MRLGRQTVSLPLSPAMSDEDAERVIDAVRSVIRT
jgi:dTDP-4-amino-4,6-dideoxygalactose transaminase